MIDRWQSTLLLGTLLTLSTAQAQMMGEADTPGEIDRIDEGVEPLIKMNKDDPTYDVWRHMRDDLSEGREPGPFNVQRFTGGFPWEGIPTFFHLPLALTKQDLEAGQVEVAIFGAEMYNGMRVQGYGPMEMRAGMKSEVYHNLGAWMMPELDSGLTALQELTVVDYGDAAIHPLSMEQSIPEVRKMVTQTRA